MVISAMMKKMKKIGILNSLQTLILLKSQE